MKTATCHPEAKHYCKGLCANCYMTQFRRSKPEYRAYMSEYLKRYRKEQPGKIALHEAKRRADPVKRARDQLTRRNSAYQQKYGITLAEAHAMLEQQGRCCAICQCEITERSMNVDHCHTTGRVRGLLCTGCNTGLGLLGDTAESLQEALLYLIGSDRKTELIAKGSPAAEPNLSTGP